jgi:hypothetical protein
MSEGIERRLPEIIPDSQIREDLAARIQIFFPSDVPDRNPVTYDPEIEHRRHAMEAKTLPECV